MVDINNISLGQVSEFISYIPRRLTEVIVSFLNEQGLPVSQRFIGLLIAFLTVLLIYIATKISKPIIKVILWILIILMIVGILLPTW